jgi:glycosyltransferase 2 family protein
MADQEQPLKPPQIRLWRYLPILIVMGLAVHLLLPQITALEKSWQVLKSLLPWAVGLAFIAQILSYLGSGYLLQNILRMAKQQGSLWLNTLIVVGSTSVGMLAGGMVGSSAAIYRWTSGRKGNIEGATLASIFWPFFDNLMLVLFSIFGLIHLLLVHDLTQIQGIGFSLILLCLGLVLGGVLLAARYQEKTIGIASWLSGRVAHLRRKPFDPQIIRYKISNLFNAWDTLRKGAWLRLTLGAFLNISFDILTLYFLFLAAGENISPGVLLAGYGLPILLGRIAFILPGGVGVVESSMTMFYTGLGVPSSITVVVVLGYRLISFWLPSVLGFAAAAYLGAISEKKKQGGEGGSGAGEPPAAR